VVVAHSLSNASFLGQPMQSGTNLETLYSTAVRVASDAEIRQPGRELGWPISFHKLMKMQEKAKFAH
jgi:hypothetical protein